MTYAKICGSSDASVRREMGDGKEKRKREGNKERDVYELSRIDERPRKWQGWRKVDTIGKVRRAMVAGKCSKFSH